MTKSVRRLINVLMCMLLCIQYFSHFVTEAKAEEINEVTADVHTLNQSLEFTADSGIIGKLEQDGYEWYSYGKTLYIKDLALTGNPGSDSAIKLPDGSRIEFSGTNTISYNGSGSAIYVNGNLSLTGLADAALTVRAGDNADGITAYAFWFSGPEDEVAEESYPYLEIYAGKSGVQEVVNSYGNSNSFHFRKYTRTYIEATNGINVPNCSTLESYKPSLVTVNAHSTGTEMNYGINTRYLDTGGGKMVVNADPGIGLRFWHIVEQVNQGTDLEISGTAAAAITTDTSEYKNRIIALSTVSVQEPWMYDIDEYVIDRTTGTPAKKMVIRSPLRSVNSLTLSDTSLVLTPGETYQLNAAVDPEKETVWWSSDNESAVTVDQNGTLRAEAIGTAAVTALTMPGYKAVCKVTVVNAAGDFTYSLDDEGNAEITQYNGNTASVIIPDTIDGHPVTSIGYQAFADHAEITSIILPEALARIGEQAFIGCDGITRIELNQNLKSLGNEAFSSTLSAVDYYGTPDDWNSVSVEGTNSALDQAFFTYHFLQLEQHSVTLYAGDKITLSKNSSPSDNTLTWRSSNYSVASPNTSGAVTAYKAGTAVITVSAEKGRLQDTCTVTVLAKAAGISFESASLTMIEGDTLQMEPVYTPEGSGLSKVIWTSSDENVAHVDENGLVTAYIPGTVTITASSEDGSLTASCILNIFKAVSSIMLNYDALTIDKDQKFTIEPYIDPVDAGNKNIIWTSDHPEYVAVDADGTVTGVDYGTAVITATTEDKGKTVSVEITVMPNGGYEYVDNGETVAVSGYKGVNTILYIPSEIDGKPVTEIWDDAFNGKGTIVEVHIPESVINIWDRAFKNCGNLEKVYLPAKLEMLGNYVFENCGRLDGIELPNSIKMIGSAVFQGCYMLSSIEIPDSIKAIAEGMFQNCYDLKTVKLPASLVSIGSSVFTSCRSLETIILPDTLKSIGYYAFSYCENLTKINLPAQLTEMQSIIFQGCKKLRTAGPVGSGSNIEYAWTDVIPANAFSSSNMLSRVTIADGITEIGAQAFAGCTSLSAVQFPDSLQSIGESSFAECSRLLDIALPEGVVSIAGSAFSRCSRLYKVSLPKSLTEIGANVFGECPELTSAGPDETYSITFAWDTSIPANAFRDITGLTEITLPETVQTIGDDAFYRTGIEEITLPDNLESIGSSVFGECVNLKELIIPDGVQTIGSNLCCNCSRLEKTVIPASVKMINTPFENCPKLTSAGPTGSESNIEFGWTDVIPNDAFRNTMYLTDIVIPDTVKSIGEYAFQDCSKLTAIKLPENLREIKNAAFMGCSSIQEISIPKKTNAIGMNAFESCASLKTVRIPYSVKQIEGNAFSGCDAIEEVYYYGTEKEWNAINFNWGNECLQNAHINYLPGIRVNLDRTYAYIGKGRTLQLNASVTPEDAAVKTLKYSSSDPSVAEVDQNGLITAKALGTAVITVEVTDGSASEICEITVVKPVESVTLDQTEISVKAGEGFQLTAAVSPDDAYNKNVTWISGNEYIAAVDSSGYVSTSNPGTTFISAITEDGSLEAACNLTVTQPVSSIIMNTQYMTLKTGQAANLYVSFEPWNASDQGLKWESSDPAVATVNENGEVTAVARGSAVIKAVSNDGNHEAACSLTVIQPVTGVEIEQKEINLLIGQGVQLSYLIKPDNADRQSVVWSSNDYTVVLVDGSGYVTAFEKGSANITVTSEDGRYTDSCTVRVIQPVTGISLSSLSLTMSSGTASRLTASIKPATADNKHVIWESSDPDVVRVADGAIYAQKAGSASITATTEDGSYAAVCDITVVDSVSGISLNQQAVRMNVGQSTQLRAAVTPAGAYNQNVIFDSNDLTVAEVDSSGNVTAIGQGTAIITATAEDGGYTAECEVTVVQPANGISLNRLNAVIPVGKQIRLTASVRPATAANKNLIWESADPTIATVDQYGMINGLKAGKTEIRVTTEDGNYSAGCELTVEEPVTGVMLNQSSASMNVGQNLRLRAEITPSTAANPKLIWDSSDLTVAEVDENGTVTAIGKGTADIIVTTDDGGYTASCTVTVSQPATGISLNKETLAMKPGTESRLTALVQPGNADNRKVIWTSSNDSIVSVDEEGMINAAAEGTAYVTARSEDGSYTAICEVNVSKVKVIVYGCSLNLRGKVGVNYYLEIPEEELDNLTVVMTRNGIPTRIKASDGTPSTQDGRKMYFYTYETAAKEMRDDVILTIEDENGRNVTLIKDLTEYEKGYAYSAKTYFEKALAGGGSEKIKPLVKALETYGKYAQIYFDYNVTDDVQAVDSVDVKAEELESYQAVVSGTVNGISYAGGSLELDADTGYRVFFALESGHSISEYSFSIGGKAVTAKKRAGSSNLYYVEVNGIAGKDLGVMNLIEVKSGNSRLQVKYGPLTYAYTALTSTKTKEPIKNVSKSIYKYYQEAKTYFGN